MKKRTQFVECHQPHQACKSKFWYILNAVLLPYEEKKIQQKALILLRILLFIMQSCYVYLLNILHSSSSRRPSEEYA